MKIEESNNELKALVEELLIELRTLRLEVARSRLISKRWKDRLSIILLISVVFTASATTSDAIKTNLEESEYPFQYIDL